MGNMPSGRCSKRSGSRKFSKKLRSINVVPVRSQALRAVKKLSHSQPARSRDGQSMKMSSAFCRNVRTPAANRRSSRSSLQANWACWIAGCAHSRRYTPRISHSPSWQMSFK